MLSLLTWAIAAVIVPTAANRPAGVANLEAVAEKLVKQCAGVHEGDLVVVSGSLRDLELLEDIAVEVRSVGAWPLLVPGTERLTRRMVEDVPAAFDTSAPGWEMALGDRATVTITVEAGDDPALLGSVPLDRIAAREKASRRIAERLLARGVRQVSLGNGLYPTAALARHFRIGQEQLARIFWDGVNADSDELRVTDPAGTDLTLRVEGRTVFVSDGVISAEDRAQGGVACQARLPAGEVYLTPVPGTAEGRIVAARQHFLDKDVAGLSLSFRAGKLVEMSAKSGIAPLLARYGAADSRRDEFGLIDIGINSKVRRPAGSRMDSFVPAGTVALGFGNNLWAGGDNRSDFGWACILTGATVTIDGRPLVTNGALDPSLGVSQ